MKHLFSLIIVLILTVDASSQSKPNIIFIVADDQRMGATIHALGSKEIITPHLDTLYKSGGTAFKNGITKDRTYSALGHLLKKFEG